MTSFPVNPHRFDPYKNFKFRVIIDGKVVPNVSRVGPLKRRTATILVRDGEFRQPLDHRAGPDRVRTVW